MEIKMRQKKIAIIGGGGAGTVAAWALSKKHEVKLFEAEQTIGGHAYTYYLKENNQVIPIDLGVEYFSEKQAPNLYALLNHLNIETEVAPLSFSYHNNTTGEYWSNNGKNTTLYSLLKSEFSKFHIQMHEVVHLYSSATKKMTLGEFLKRNNYSSTFINQALLPLLTTFSSCKSPTLEYSLMFCALSFSMGLLSFFHPTYWRKAHSGIASYLQALEKRLQGKIFKNKKVQKVLRYPNIVRIYFEDGHIETFDEVVFATHADVTLSLIDSPSDNEQKLLSSFEYTNIECVLHTDNSIQGSSDNHCYCEYKSLSNEFDGSLTRNVSALPWASEAQSPLFVTFDPVFPIDQKMILCQKHWKIPKLRPEDMVRKRLIKNIQGKNRSWFCGTDTSLTGHEGAILSGLVIAHRLGGSYPFSNNNWAKVQFDLVQGLMGVYRPSERIYSSFQAGLYSLGKHLGLQKNQISNALLDLYT